MQANEFTQSQRCPFANTAVPIQPQIVKCPFHAHKQNNYSNPNKSVQMYIVAGSMKQSKQQADLLKDIGGGDVIRQHCTRFYANVFNDNHLDQFMFMDDGAEAHGKRLGDWIIEKMGGEGHPWTDSGRLGQRWPTHHKAWNSHKRTPNDKGKHFSLYDTVIWMCIFFWSARECGMDQHKAYFQWLIQVISHFAYLYDVGAPKYAITAAEWSQNPENIKIYKAGLPDKTVDFKF